MYFLKEVSKNKFAILTMSCILYLQLLSKVPKQHIYDSAKSCFNGKHIH